MRDFFIKNIITHFYYFPQIFTKGLLYFLLFVTSLLFISLISSRQNRFCALILPKGQ